MQTRCAADDRLGEVARRGVGPGQLGAADASVRHEVGDVARRGRVTGGARSARVGVRCVRGVPGDGAVRRGRTAFTVLYPGQGNGGERVGVRVDRVLVDVERALHLIAAATVAVDVDAGSVAAEGVTHCAG